MAHLPRFILEDHVYHVTAAVKDREAVFSDLRFATVVVEAIQFVRKDRALILAYAVMPDHMHALIVPRNSYVISQVTQSIKGYAARRINQLLGRRGALWQRSFHDRMMRDERQLLETIAYIDENPVAAGLVENAQEYPYSSAGRDELTDLQTYL